MIRFYLAAPFELQDEARRLSKILTDDGMHCTSRWLEAEETPSDLWARRDLVDVALCDVLVALNPSSFASSGTGGRHVELGYALALQKPIVLIGARTHIFHHLSHVRVVELDHLTGLSLAVRDVCLSRIQC